MRPLRVLALDLSLRATGLAVTHDQVGEPRLSCRTITAPKSASSDTKMDHRRAHQIIVAVIAAAECKPDVVAIESPLLLDKGDTSIRLAELHGPIKHWLWAHGIPYADVHPSHVKQYATGNGNADKEAVLAAVIARYGKRLSIHTYDEADAVSALAFALHHYGQPLADVPLDHSRALAGPTKWPKLTLEGDR